MVYKELGSSSNQVGTLEQLEQGFPDCSIDLNSNPITRLSFWPLLLCLWIYAHQYEFEWSKSFEDRITRHDFAWLKNAMWSTFARLSETHKKTLQDEMDSFIALSKMMDWKEAVKGHEYRCEIEVTLGTSEPVKLRRYYRGWSPEEAMANMNLAKNEQFMRWL